MVSVKETAETVQPHLRSTKSYMLPTAANTAQSSAQVVNITVLEKSINVLILSYFPDL